MLGDIALLLVGAVLVNNFVLVQFLGLCPFMGVSNKLETAMGMSVATTFVLTLASVCSYLTYNYLQNIKKSFFPTRGLHFRLLHFDLKPNTYIFPT